MMAIFEGFKRKKGNYNGKDYDNVEVVLLNQEGTVNDTYGCFAVTTFDRYKNANVLPKFKTVDFLADCGCATLEEVADKFIGQPVELVYNQYGSIAGIRPIKG